MGRVFSLASWNVEHFRNEEVRVERVIEFLERQDPDIFALYEVEGKTVYRALMDEMPHYTFHITEGPQVQEILVGVTNRFTSFFTQRLEFKSGNQLLRPGALLSIREDGTDYSILFLHTKSGSDPIGWGMRDDMYARALHFKRVLDRAAGGYGEANFLFLGDLNTMGMNYTYARDHDIDPGIEIGKMKRAAQNYDMRFLSKDAPATWWNGPDSSYEPADLDHVVASDQLSFRTWEDGAEVAVRGWPAMSDPEDQADWIEKYSDHGLLYLELWED